MKTEPAQKEIDDVLNECRDRINSGTSKFRGMTYEQGVEAAICWLTEGDSNPMEQ